MNVTEADAERIALALGKAKRSGKVWLLPVPITQGHRSVVLGHGRGRQAAGVLPSRCDQKTVIAELRWRRLWPEPEKTNGAAGKATQSRLVATTITTTPTAR